MAEHEVKKKQQLGPRPRDVQRDAIFAKAAQLGLAIVEYLLLDEGEERSAAEADMANLAIEVKEMIQEWNGMER